MSSLKSLVSSGDYLVNILEQDNRGYQSGVFGVEFGVSGVKSQVSDVECVVSVVESSVSGV